MLPTTATIVDITLGGHSEKMYFSFRAWNSLQVNPLKPAEVQKFLEDLNPDKAARWVLAGLEGYQALFNRLRDDAAEPVKINAWDLDRVLDVLDTQAFGAIVAAIGAASGAPAEPDAGNV
jgi:hypothetical protein